jgi:hypothetical protein
MTLEVEIGKTLNESFRAALVLTGSIEGAERAVTNAIAALGSGLSAHALLVETARSAFQQRPCSGASSSILPVELQAVANLFPTHRYCFALRVLVGFDLKTCSEILTLPRYEVEQALCQSLLDLPRAVEYMRCAGKSDAL